MEFVSGKCYVEYLNTGHFSKPVIDCRLWFVSIMPKLNKTLAGMSMDIIHCTSNNININTNMVFPTGTDNKKSRRPLLNKR